MKLTEQVKNVKINMLIPSKYGLRQARTVRHL